VPTADELRERLEDIGEALADLAMDALRSALEDGDADARARERRLTRARRSVEKAAALLGDSEPDPELDL
jgi:predicted phage gp36 major capsid-like protein